MDVASLRFGSFREVNYGKGCRVIQTRRSGKDLIWVFDGKGSGITTDEFAPKLIGKDKEGRMLYGYARLPYVDYLPPILSAMRPVFVPSQKKVQVEVQNFGLSPASDFEVEVFQNGASMGRSPISTLQSYEKEMISFTPSDGSWSERSDYQVKFVREGQVVETNNFRCKE